MPHIHDKIDFTVEVFIVHNNKVLLRKHDKLGIWLSVGGHIELDEDPNQAAVREVKEEVGLDITLLTNLRPNSEKTPGYTELIPPYFLNMQQNTPTHKHVTLVYIATAKTDKIIQPDTHEKSECIWLTKDELVKRTDIKSTVKQYGLFALCTQETNRNRSVAK